jgi:NADH-ubiquinone oxidoreductase chain 2
MAGRIKLFFLICMINLRAEDVYDAVPTNVTTFIVVVPKISILILLLEWIFHLGLSLPSSLSYANVLLISSLLSLIVGTVGGLVQFRLKRLLAYSSISHMGFMLLVLAGLTQQSVQAFLFYLIQYSLSNINIFFIVIAIGYSLKKNKEINLNLVDRENSPLQLISQLKGYFKHNPVLAISLAITLFSFLGVPPLVGFFAKQAVLSAALQNGHVFLCVIAILTSVIGGVYYLLLVKEIFFSDNSGKEESSLFSETTQLTNGKYIQTLLSSSLTIPISVITLMILLFILSPNILLSSANIFALILFMT